jgi:hypothetical protein
MAQKISREKWSRQHQAILSDWMLSQEGELLDKNMLNSCVSH